MWIRANLFDDVDVFSLQKKERQSCFKKNLATTLEKGKGQENAWFLLSWLASVLTHLESCREAFCMKANQLCQQSCLREKQRSGFIFSCCGRNDTQVETSIVTLWLHRHASKSLPFLPGTPKQITSPPGSSKVSSAQTRPPSPGNIRPVKKEIKPEGEKKRPEKEAEKANEVKTEESKGTSAGAGEPASQEQLTVQAEPTQGKETYYFKIRNVS